MEAQTVFFRVSIKAIFCLALVSTLTNLVFTQNLYMSLLDDTRNALMPSSGTAAPPSNKFLEALFQIERAVYEAHSASSRYDHSEHRLAKIKENIKLATQKRNYLFARKSIGHGLYTVMQLDKKRNRKRRAPEIGLQGFIDSVKQELGKESFETFMSVRGEVTLMFAIDNSGSMSSGIQAAKDIATSIIDHPRDEQVDFILSPFSDPETGPVTYNDYGEGSQFKNAIQALSASGGGDCPELAFKGILDAMAESPNPGSPLYVFTDATAKDATDENMIEVLRNAEAGEITINFFTTGQCSRSSDEKFEKVARETCGLMLTLPSSDELRQFSSQTSAILKGSTCQGSGGSGNFNGRKRRSAGEPYTYNIPVDDTTEKIIITVSTERMRPNIDLRDSTGASVTSGKISLSKGAIYEINHPRPGTWQLIVSEAGKHTYLIKGSSQTNVDFEYFFVMIPTRGRRRQPIPILQPLQGQQAVVILTVAGANKINSGSLSLDLMSTDERRLSTATVTPHGTSGAHFSASFTPPSEPFKLKLRGTTKKGNAFERNSRKTVHPSHALIRVLYARNEYTIPAGGSGFVMFVVHNTGPTEIFDIKVKDRLEYVAHLRRNFITIRQGRTSFFSATFRAPSTAARGENDEVLATITGRTSGKTVGHVVKLMVV